LGPLPVATDIAGQRAVLLAGGIQKERVIVPWAGASALGAGFPVPVPQFPDWGSRACRGLLHLKMDESFSMFPVSEKEREPMGKAPSLHRKVNRKMVCLYKTPFSDFPMAPLWVFRCIQQSETHTELFDTSGPVGLTIFILH